MWVNAGPFGGILRQLHGFPSERSTVRQRLARFAWLLIGVCASAAMLAARPAAAQLFRPFSNDTRNILEGNWQSCREGDGQYSERVYDGKWPGLGPFELHLGPFHEFAFFRGIQEEHREHNSADNLLKPYNVEIRANAARQSWDVDGLHLEIALAGGSREQCESWYVSLKRVETTVSH